MLQPPKRTNRKSIIERQKPQKTMNRHTWAMLNMSMVVLPGPLALSKNQKASQGAFQHWQL